MHEQPSGLGSKAYSPINLANTSGCLCRELADAVAGLEQVPKQQTAAQLQRLALVLTQQKLELQQAFAVSQGSRKQGLQLLELEAVMRKVAPDVTALEMQTLLWSLWQHKAGATGHILLQVNGIL